ncbi:VWA domain-containing protein, partial [bacterium]
MNIDFRNPIFFYFIPACLAPLLIYLLTTRRYARRIISYIPFIHNAEKKIFKTGRLKVFLLIAIRTLLIAFFILLFANPVYRSISAGRESPHTIVLVDTSLSMRAESNGKTTLDRAKEVLYTFISLKPENEKIAIVPFSIDIDKEIVFERDKTYLTSSVLAIEPSYNATSFSKAVFKCIMRFEKIKSPVKRIILLSDFRSSKLYKIKIDKSNQIKDRIDLICINIYSDFSRNRTLTDVEIPLIYKSSPFTVNSFIHTPSNFDYKSYSVNLKVNSSVMDTQIVSSGFKRINKVSLGGIIREHGEYICSVILEEDSLLHDNFYYFALKVQKPLNILLVEGDPGITPYDAETYYLLYALNPKKHTFFTKTKVVTFSEFKEMDVEPFDVLFLANVDSFDSAAAGKLQIHLIKDKPLLISLGDKCNIDLYNKYIADILPGRLKKIVSKDFQIVPSKDNIAVDSVLDKDYFSNVECSRLIDIDKKKGAQSVLIAKDKKNNEYPLLIRQNYLDNHRYGTVFLYSTTVDYLWNELPYKPVYVALWQEIVQNFSGLRDKLNRRESSILAGSAYEEFIDDQMVSSVQVIMPDGIPQNVPYTKRKGRVFVRFLDTGLPGLYTLKWLSKNGYKSKLFAVNIDPLEITAKSDGYTNLYSQFKRICKVSRYAINLQDNILQKLNRILYG